MVEFFVNITLLFIAYIIIYYTIYFMIEYKIYYCAKKKREDLKWKKYTYEEFNKNIVEKISPTDLNTNIQPSNNKISSITKDKSFKYFVFVDNKNYDLFENYIRIYQNINHDRVEVILLFLSFFDFLKYRCFLKRFNYDEFNRQRNIYSNKIS